MLRPVLLLVLRSMITLSLSQSNYTGSQLASALNYKILLLTYKALNDQAPSYITDLLKPYAPTRNLRSSSKNLLNVPPVKLVSYGQRCFSYVAPSLWNPLPDNIRQSSSLQNFKTQIKTHLKINAMTQISILHGLPECLLLLLE